MRNIPLDFPIYEGNYGNSFPDEQYYVILFDALPSMFIIKKYYDQAVVNHIKSMGFIEECRLADSKRYVEGMFSSLFINKSKSMFITTQFHRNRNSGLQLEFLYDIKKGDLDKQLDMLNIESYLLVTTKSNIQLVRSDMGHLDTEEYDLHVPEFDLELNYGKGFIAINNLILKRLNTPNDKGIIVLYGDHGTGKTTYIKFLTKQILEKDILFIPPSMAEMLSEPSIIPFLMDHRNSILIIEDAEQVIGDRRGKASSAGVSNILNLTDGILGDCLNIQVIATCNILREKIDSALLRKGRLICEHRFDKLNVEETNILLKYLNKDVVSDKGLTLADIYNIDEDLYRSPEPETIGFKVNEK
jgi:hypothetical protein